MCAICGWYNRKKALNKERIIAMNQAAKHRGPDDEGYMVIDDDMITPFVGEDSVKLPYMDINTTKELPGFLALGHRRLSIIDLSMQGHQPMYSPDQKICVTFNGEIYNYVEIRNELENKGYDFKSNSDTEVLLLSYKEWGTDCVSHLNGMWGFAIWDNEKKCLFCSRDRLGAKPFYYYVDDDNLIFSSEIKQLIQNSIVPRVINESMLVTQMMWGISDFSEETLINKVRCLKGGHSMIVDMSSRDRNVSECIHVYCYWDIDTEKTKSNSFIKEAFEAHENAVRIRTRSDVPIAILLSGGLDSSSLVAEISEYYRETGRKAEDINTFTSCYEGFDEGDEREYAHAVNKYCGTRENLIYPDEKDTFSAFKDMIWHVESLGHFSTLGSFMTLKEVGKRGIKVIINGQGADETMFGYERYYTWYLMDCLKRKGIFAFVKEFIEAAKNSRLSIIELFQYVIYFNNIYIRKKRCQSRMAPYITKKVANIFKNNTDVEKYIKFQSLSEMQYNEIRGTQLTHILRMDDRCYMAFSMESRVPFIDYKYVEAATGIPESMKIKDGYTKYLLRKNIENKLPEDVVWRRNKMGWPSPRERWISRLDKERVEDLFIDARSSKFFNIDAVKKLWKKNPNAYAVEVFLSTELFMRLFGVEAA